jgi:acetyl esterase/lipase
LAPPEILRRFPPTLLVIAGQDFLQADSHGFAEKLKEVSVDVSVHVYEEAPHMFLSMDKYLPSGALALKDLVVWVKEAI